jgi:acyl carrier protein
MKVSANGIEINDEEMEKLVTVADVVRCIEEKVAGKEERR